MTLSVQVLIIGLRNKDVAAVQRQVNTLYDCVKIIYGGSIDDGSNMTKLCLSQLDDVDLVLINTGYARYVQLPSGTQTERISGKSSAILAIQRFMESRRRDDRP